MKESTRQKKYGKLIQKELSDIFNKDMSHVFKGGFITITVVRVSPDLSSCRVYLSMLLVNDKEALLEEIREQRSEFRYHLGNRIRNQARIIPQLHFYLDTTGEEADKIDNILSDLDIPPDDESDEDKD